MTGVSLVLLAKWKDEGFLTPQAFDQLSVFADLLVQWNSRINLTGLQSRDDVEERLIGESILAAKVFPLGQKRVLDFGSGAGIPGLVWVIFDPTIHLTSIEIRAKKVTFQKEVARQLNLKVEIIQGHFPDAVRDRKFDVIATRAVRVDETLARKANSLLESRGSLLRFGSTADDPGWRSIPISARSSLLVRPANID